MSSHLLPDKFLATLPSLISTLDVVMSFVSLNQDNGCKLVHECLADS